MKFTYFMMLTLAGLALSACSDTERAQRAAHYSDRPARIVCSGYGGTMVDTTTTGRIEFDSTGRIDFVDAQTGGLVKTEGECVIRYAR